MLLKCKREKTGGLLCRNTKTFYLNLSRPTYPETATEDFPNSSDKEKISKEKVKKE